jgi:hypothetical protein
MRWIWFFVGVSAGATAVVLPRAAGRRRALAGHRMAQAPAMGAPDASVAPTTQQTLKIAGLVKLQRALADASMHVAETGQLDAQTQLALRLFQEREGLVATGLPDYETLRRLDLSPDEVFRRLGKFPITATLDRDSR